MRELRKYPEHRQRENKRRRESRKAAKEKGKAEKLRKIQAQSISSEYTVEVEAKNSCEAKSYIVSKEVKLVDETK